MLLCTRDSEVVHKITSWRLATWGGSDGGRIGAQLVWHARCRYKLGEAVCSASQQSWVSKRESISMPFRAQVQKHQVDMSRWRSHQCGSLSGTWMACECKGEKYELKHTIVGPEAGLCKEVRILSRRVRWTQDDIQYECDRRHADIVVSHMGMEGMKPFSTHGRAEVIDSFKKETDEKESNAEVRKRSLKHGSDSLFGALAARIKYIAKDRADPVFTNNCVSHFMSEPTPAAWQALKRIGRYLTGACRIVQTFKWGAVSSQVERHGDSGWAGDKVSRRSTSGGAVIWNGHVFKAWSVWQKTIALSSAEAELYAMTKCATQTPDIQLMQDFNIVREGAVHTDFFCSLGIVSRVGIGRIRHMQVKHFWLQGRLLKHDLKPVKIDGKFNVSDFLPTYLERRYWQDIAHHGYAGARHHSCVATMQNNSFDIGEGVHDWIRTQKEQWLGSDVDKPHVTERWHDTVKEHHEKLKNEVVARSRWLREHVRPRTTQFLPSNHTRGPSQARHVPRMSISAFVDGSSNRDSVFVDDWRWSPKEVHMAQRKCTKLTAFVNQLRHPLQCISYSYDFLWATFLYHRCSRG